MKIDINLDQTKLEKKLLSWGKYIPVKSAFEILGFSRVDNFIRFLKNPKYYYGVILYETSDAACEISLRLFFDLLYKRAGSSDQIDRLFTNVWNRKYEDELIKFTNASTKSIFRFDRYQVKVSGKFYTYSINTLNIAYSNDLCPFELYGFAVKKWMREHDHYDFYIEHSSKIPVISFDNKKHIIRYHVMPLLLKIYKSFPMDDLQRKRFKIFYQVMDRMLMMQFEIDLKREEREGKDRDRLDKMLFGEILTDEQLSELKKIYRKAAFLCHPDISGSDGSSFKQLTEYYNKKNINKVQQIYQNLNKVC